MTDDRTPHLSLPLPHQDNLLEEDVLRLREAVTAVDAKFEALDALLASDDPDLGSIQEIVDVLRDNVEVVVDHLGSGGSAHAAATDAANGFMSAADKSKLDGVSLGAVMQTVPIVPVESGQTIFEVFGGYDGDVLVFLNGVKLEHNDFLANASIAPYIMLNEGVDASDRLEVVRFRLALRQ